MDIRFLYASSPAASCYQVTFTPEELAVIRERGLQSRLVLDLSPRGDIDDVRRKIADKKNNLDHLDHEINLELANMDRANKFPEYDDPLRNFATFDRINNRLNVLIPRKHSLVDEIAELEKLEQRLIDPNSVITLGTYLTNDQGVVETRQFRTPSEARNFEIQIEKALKQFEKYLAQFIPEPEEPETILPTQDFEIPRERWFQSVWLICPPGGGKTTALLNIIQRQMPNVAAADCTVIVIDGQGQDQSLVAPLYHHYGDIACYIDPRNPIPINPFRKSGDRKLDFNAARGMLSYFLSGMLDQPLTENHITILENVLELIFEIPDASLYTLLSILDPNRKDLKEYDACIDRIDDPYSVVQRFLRTELFQNRIFSPRREELVSRLYAMLRDRTFRDMFSNPRSDFCLADMMNDGHLILIDCDKNYLTNRSEIFGRFFIALIHQAALARSSYPRDMIKKPVYVFIDECHDFIRNDERIYEILEQARKQNIGVILANQFTTQITNPRVLHSLFSATGTKLAARTATDTAAIAKWLRCSEADLANAPSRHFVFYTEGMKTPAYTQFQPTKLGFSDWIPPRAINPDHAHVNAAILRMKMEAADAKDRQDWEYLAEIQNAILPELESIREDVLAPRPAPEPEPEPQPEPQPRYREPQPNVIPPEPPKPTPIPRATPSSPAKTGGFELEGPELI